MTIMELETVDVATATPRDVRDLSGTVAVMATLLWWGTEQVIRTGGQDPHVLSYGLVPLIAAFVLVRPWRALPAGVMSLLAMFSVAAFAVTWVAPTGSAGGDVAASYVYATGLGAVLTAWARSATRRYALLGVLAASAGITFAEGWVAWWASRDPSHPFVGTFYWYNQEGIYLGTGVIVSVTALVARVRALRSFAWVVGPCCVAGLILSTSRGSWLATAAGLVVLVAAVTWRTGSLRALGIAAAQVATGVATWWALSGPPFFPRRPTMSAGVSDRADHGQTLGHNTGTRVQEWHDGLRVFFHWPWSGTGFHGFASGTHRVAPHPSGLYTAYAHNGVIQAFAEGGVLLGVPLVLVLGILLAAVVRGRSSIASDQVRLGALVLLAVLVAHSMIDWDWAYPSLLSSCALVAAVVLGVARVTAGRARPLGRIAALVMVLCLALAVPAAWQGGLRLSVPVGSSS